METNNITLMQQARFSLSGKWGLALTTVLVYFLVAALPKNLEGIGPVVSLIISGSFAVGMAVFSLNLSRNKEARTRQIFDGFKNFGTPFKAHLLILVFVTLRLLLLILPGFMSALSYAMTFYVLADEPGLSARQAMKKSSDMMFGNRFKLLNLALRFLGLALLCIVTLGIGFLWLFPYIQVTLAKFYDDVKEQYLKEEAQFYASKKNSLIG
jgi:uncharacterized membrane protein